MHFPIFTAGRNNLRHRVLTTRILKNHKCVKFIIDQKSGDAGFVQLRNDDSFCCTQTALKNHHGIGQQAKSHFAGVHDRREISHALSC